MWLKWSHSSFNQKKGFNTYNVSIILIFFHKKGLFMPKKDRINDLIEFKNKKEIDKAIKNQKNSQLSIPIEIFKDRNVAVLESLVEYLKDQKNLSYHEIALILNRDDRTIWTVYNRVSKKRAKK